MKNTRRLFSALLALVMVLGISAPAGLQANEVRVTIDGAAVNFDGQGPAIVDGRTLVPVRGVFEELGFDVDWEQSTQTATLTSPNHVVAISIGSANFTTNGQSYPLDVPAQIIGGRTMLPIRAVVESVGYSVDWDGSASTVVITSGGQAVVTQLTIYCTASSLATDLTNPANYWVEINGTRLAPGMTVSQLLASNVVQARDESALDTVMGSFGTAIYTFHVHDGSIWRSAVSATIRNTGQDAITLNEGIVASFAIDTFNANLFEDVVFVNGIRLGVTTRAEIIDMFGEPDVVGETTIQYRPFFDDRGDRNRSLMFAGYTFTFDSETNVVTRINMEFADFEQ